MRHVASAFLVLTVLAAGLVPASAQSQLRATPPAPAQPYKPVAITPPMPMTDPAFEALRKQLGEVAQKKDRAALAGLVVTQGFFWTRQGGNGADKRKTGIDNLSTALGLNNKNGAGWEILFSYTDDPTASPSPDRKGALCAPAEPAYDAKAFDALTKATQTDASEWSYPLSAGIEVHAAPQNTTPVIDKLGLAFVRVSSDPSPSANYMRVVTPSGKTGYVSADGIAPIGNDQICYIKDDAGNWRIVGYVGGGEPD